MTVRLPSFRMDRLVGDPDCAERYRTLESQLCRIYPNARDVHSAMTYFGCFVYHFNRLTDDEMPSCPWSLVALNGTREGTETAATAWRNMIEEFKWSERYTRRVRTTLARTLQDVVPALAAVVNPSLRNSRSLHVEATRSPREQNFGLMECLPLSIRKRHPNDTMFRLMERIGSKYVDCLHSVSKAYLQKILQLVDTLLTTEPPLIDATTPEAAWAALAALSARDWLQRYQVVFARNGTRFASATFRNHMHMLQRLHCKILQPHTACPVPLPALRGDTGLDSSSSSEDEEKRNVRRDNRSLMLKIRSEVCKGGSTTVGPYSFRPEEIRRILAGAVTTLERLIVWLLLTTGLRIGGLSRLQAGTGPFTTAHDVPRTLTTTEKNNRERCVVVGRTGRILIARWYREGRRVEADVPSLYVFPSPTKKEQAASMPCLWDVCRRVFVRAGLQTAHVHPHTFRHTFIHYMYMSGSSFDEISKVIGHANPKTTRIGHIFKAGIYFPSKFCARMRNLQQFTRLVPNPNNHIGCVQSVAAGRRKQPAAVARRRQHVHQRGLVVHWTSALQPVVVGRRSVCESRSPATVCREEQNSSPA